jgi:ketosteroid isomerase-like protein
MRKFAMLCFAVVLSLGIAEQLFAQGTRSTEEKVVRLEEQWFEAQRDSNADLLAPLLSDKFVMTSNRDKVMNKADLLAACKKTKWTLVRLSDMNSSVFGDTVIVTGDFRGDGTDALGRPMEVHERWTHTWVKMRSGGWQCVASHTSSVTM